MRCVNKGEAGSGKHNVFRGLPPPKGVGRYATGLAARSALTGWPPLRIASPMARPARAPAGPSISIGK